MQQPKRRFATLEKDRLGYLDLQPRWFQTGSAERPNDCLLEATAMELSRRGVHRDPDRARPFRCIRACLPEHPRADGDDHPGVLGDRNELGRRNPSALRVIPPQQCFERADAVVMKVEQRLVVDLELAALESEPQIAFELPPSLRSFVQLLFEESVSAAPSL